MTEITQGKNIAYPLFETEFVHFSQPYSEHCAQRGAG